MRGREWCSSATGAAEFLVRSRSRKRSGIPICAPEIEIRPEHVVHLGDVYHAGLRSDYRKNFLRHWPVSQGYENTFVLVPVGQSRHVPRAGIGSSRCCRTSGLRSRTGVATSCWRTTTGRCLGWIRRSIRGISRTHRGAIRRAGRMARAEARRCADQEMLRDPDPPSAVQRVRKRRATPGATPSADLCEINRSTPGSGATSIYALYTRRTMIFASPSCSVTAASLKR